MRSENFIRLSQLCTHYQVEMSFFTTLDEYGLIETQTIEKSVCVHQDNINDIEKMMRMHQDLNINFEGIDAVLHLLQKVDYLQSELSTLKNRLRLYED